MKAALLLDCENIQNFLPIENLITETYDVELSNKLAVANFKALGKLDEKLTVMATECSMCPVPRIQQIIKSSCQRKN